MVTTLSTMQTAGFSQPGRSSGGESLTGGPEHTKLFQENIIEACKSFKVLLAEISRSSVSEIRLPGNFSL